MVQSAPQAKHAAAVADEEEYVDISPSRGGGHGGHVVAFFAVTQLAPVVAMLLATSFVAGGMGATWWLWTVVALVALPALALFAGALFVGEQGLEGDDGEHATPAH